MEAICSYCETLIKQELEQLAGNPTIATQEALRESAIFADTPYAKRMAEKILNRPEESNLKEFAPPCLTGGANKFKSRIEELVQTELWQ